MAESSKGQPKQDRRGFSVARRAGKGAYTGKASKIKEQLIQKAKVKKEYANVLKREGKPAQQLPEIPRAKKARSESDNANEATQQQQQKQPQLQKKDAPSQGKRKRDQHSKHNNNQPHMRARMETMLDKVKKTVS